MFALIPVRVAGAIVMKITSSTRRMSMNGVTLMSARGSILLFLFFIDSPQTRYSSALETRNEPDLFHVASGYSSPMHRCSTMTLIGSDIPLLHEEGRMRLKKISRSLLMPQTGGRSTQARQGA